MLTSKTLEKAIKDSKSKNSSTQVFGLWKVVQKVADDQWLQEEYMHGSKWNMFEHMSAVMDKTNGSFYEIITGPCHFYADIIHTSEKPAKDIFPVFDKALADILGQKGITISHSLVHCRHLNGFYEAQVVWKFMSPQGKMLVLSGPTDARKLFKVVVDHLKGIPGTSDTGFDLASEVCSVFCVFIYNELEPRRVAGSSRYTLDDTESKYTRLLPVDGSFDFAVFRNNLVCHDPLDTTVDFLDVSTLVKENKT